VPRGALVETGGFDPSLDVMYDRELWFRLADSCAFVHVPEVVAQVQGHSPLGIRERRALEERQDDLVLRGFVERLSAAEVSRHGALSLAEGYFQLGRNLNERGFTLAGSCAVERGIAQLRCWDVESCQAFLEQRAATGALADELAAEVDALTRRRDELEADLAVCERDLAQIYASRSWWLTAPLRSVSGLLGRVLR
jgi:hypothetical protein